jgi:hypothetical protein
VGPLIVLRFTAGSMGHILYNNKCTQVVGAVMHLERRSGQRLEGFSSMYVNSTLIFYLQTRKVNSATKWRQYMHDIFLRLLNALQP